MLLLLCLVNWLLLYCTQLQNTGCSLCLDYGYKSIKLNFNKTSVLFVAFTEILFSSLFVHHEKRVFEGYYYYFAVFLCKKMHGDMVL